MKPAASAQKAVLAAEKYARQKATQASAKAFREAARVLQASMRGRVDDGLDNTGSPAKKVTKAYAAQRAARYGVPNDVMLVLKASGQLLENLADASAFELVMG